MLKKFLNNVILYFLLNFNGWELFISKVEPNCLSYSILQLHSLSYPYKSMKYLQKALFSPSPTSKSDFNRFHSLLHGARNLLALFQFRNASTPFIFSRPKNLYNKQNGYCKRKIWKNFCWQLWWASQGPWCQLSPSKGCHCLNTGYGGKHIET